MTACDPKATLAKVQIDAIHEHQIRDAIDSYLADPSQLPLTDELVVLAKSLDALPTYCDMGAALLVRPDGTVLAVSTDVSWDENAVSSVVTDVFWIRVAFEKGSERFPDAASAFKALIEDLE
jgi:hypothetical protein